ncbi:MAG: hypothetical protein ACE5JH_02975 [Acidobacteriota bacterium]
MRKAVPLLLAILALPAALASSAAAGPPVGAHEPTPVVIVGNTHFAPLLAGVTLAPGESVRRTVDLRSFSRLSILAAAESGPNDGRIEVATIFGPPSVPVPNRLDLSFGGRGSARSATRMPVFGPVLTLEVVNRSPLPAQVSLSVFAKK